MKAILLFSGGLDSRLVLELLKRLKINVIPVFFNLPFGNACSINCAFSFAQLKGFKLVVIDCTKGRNFKEFLSIIKKPKFGYGSCMNPCIDCRIFMLKKAKEIMKKEKADFIATGEVLGERPMSQRKNILFLVEKEAGLKGRLLRPLSAKLLPETIMEKKGLVDRNKLYDIKGRSRKKQIELAKKFKIKYPSPAGGCLLTDENFCRKLKDLFEHKRFIKPEDIELLKIGRHFRIGKDKIVVGRNEEENKKLEKFKGIRLEPVDFPGPTVLLQEKNVKKAARILVSYSKFKEGYVMYDKKKIKVKKIKVDKYKI